ncbi:MAG: radical SAM protein [Nitrospinae bacterium]|nr:radical SAM protein [Nitrospinota bacterium]
MGLLQKVKSRLRLPLEIIKTRIQKTPKPLVVLLYVTDRCNLACKYCVGNWSNRKIKDFSTDEIKRIISECVELGSVHFTIHGGEILLREDTEEVISFIKNKGAYVNVVTNGIILPENIEKLKGVDSLCISLDGKEEANDANRGKNSYQKIIKAIEAAVTNNFPLAVQSTITKNNMKEIPFLVENAKKYGYQQQFSLLLKPLNDKNDQLGLTDEEMKTSLLEIRRYKALGYPVFTSYRTLDNAINWPFSYSEARVKKHDVNPEHNMIPCYYGKLKLVIDANGFAFPCSSLNDSFSAKNVLEVGVKEAYQHILDSNDCECCYYLTQNDWSLLLGMDIPQYWGMAKIQLKQLLSK